MVSMKEIAGVCKVSPGTVSKALAGGAGVGAKTRARIVRVAERFGYLPNALVRGIQSGRSGTVAVAASNLGDPWVALVLRGALSRLEKAGQEAIVFDWDSKVRDGAHILRTMRERRVDGLLMFPPAEIPSEEYMAELRAFDRPVVLLDQTWPHLEFDFVGTDDATGAREAVSHLLALGHRHVAILAFTAVSTGRIRLCASLEALRAGGVEVPPRFLADGCDSFEAAHDAARRLLRLAPGRRPTAFICFNDIVALGAVAAAADAGIAVPGDVSVTGFCDLPLASQVRPALTTVRQDPEAVGQTAAGLVARRIESRAATDAARKVDPTIRELCAIRSGPVRAAPAKDGGDGRHVLLPTRLVVRGSTAAPPFFTQLNNPEGIHR